jgi:hypothetical protein
MTPRPRALVATLLLAAVALPAGARAGGRIGGPPGFFVHGSVSSGSTTVAGAAFSATGLGFAAYGRAEYGAEFVEDTAYLIVDATPPSAEVYLDGRRLGTAGDLVALAMPIPLGTHAVHVTAPGFRTRAWRFTADGSFAVHLRAPLTKDGGPEMAPKPPDVRRAPAEP